MTASSEEYFIFKSHVEIIASVEKALTLNFTSKKKKFDRFQYEELFLRYKLREIELHLQQKGCHNVRLKSLGYTFENFASRFVP